jgi:hypothetical protein
LHVARRVNARATGVQEAFVEAITVAALGERRPLAQRFAGNVARLPARRASAPGS